MRVAVLVSDDLRWALLLARTWVGAGDGVQVVLLDAAAAAARPGHEDAAAVGAALRDGVVVGVHDDALRSRALTGGGLVDGAKVVDLDEIADLVTEGADKAVWL
ncbi:MAG TPA: hypothetical protein VG452_07545 [Egibacteraceae bacterium]|nr:hypothetical protein [Egibacteraceae bacterium]